jgi:hypothetical protein
VEDIAKHQRSDSKELWAKIRPTIKVGLVEMELPEQVLCKDICRRDGSAILERCRAPCLLGFEHCPAHIAQPTQEESGYIPVKRVLDHEGIVYFVDGKGEARSKDGFSEGIVEDGILRRFEYEI